jgi:hypothetical protein
LEGAGRVEDTFNLLGHAARKIVQCAAALLKTRPEDVCRAAGIPLLLSSSIKAGLDINWSNPKEKDEAIDLLAGQVASLDAWIEKNQLSIEEPVRPYIEGGGRGAKAGFGRNEGRPIPDSARSCSRPAHFATEHAAAGATSTLSRRSGAASARAFDVSLTPLRSQWASRSQSTPARSRPCSRPHPTLNEDPQAPSTACLARQLRDAAPGFPLRSSSPSELLRRIGLPP